MFEKIYKFLGLQYAKFQFRNDIERVQPLAEFFSGSKSVLIILPIGYENAILASQAMHSLHDRLKHLRLTVINNSTRITSLIKFPKCEVIRIGSGDINRFFLPTQSLLQRILVREYDVAMDLNLAFVLHSAYICKVSKARIRIGIAHMNADWFYNVQIVFKKPHTPQALYERFVEYLAMF